jgi:hypothetical protein
MTLPAPVAYTDKDFDALRARLFDLVRSVYPSWTDTAVANFGNILLESFAYIGDVLGYYQDRQAREGRFAFATLRRNMIALCKLIDYRLGNAAAASVDVVVTIENPDRVSGAVGPAGGSTTPVVVRTAEITDPIRGELDVPFSIPPGQASASATWRHVLTRPRYAVASTGLADQEVLLPFTPFLWASETVSTSGDAGPWTIKENFLDSLATDRHYTLEVDHLDRARLRFGDGRNGKIPSGDIRVDYRTGGGLLGNLEPNALTTVETTLVDALGRSVPVTITNALAAIGGSPREEVEAARVAAPRSLRVLSRAVCREDFEIVAEQVPGVGRTLMLTSNEDVAIAENRGSLFVIPTTGGTPSAGLLDDVRGAFGLDGNVSPLPNGKTYPPTITFQLSVFPAPYKAVDVAATIWIASGYAATAVAAAVRAALVDYFSPLNADGTANQGLDWGYNLALALGVSQAEVPWSDVFNAIRDVPGVRKVDQGMRLNGSVASPTIASYEFPAIGTIALTNGLDGGAL